MSYIRPLRHIERDDLAEVGGKGLGLALLLKAGLPVPDGFCLSAQAFRDAPRAHDGAISGLHPELHDELARAFESLGAEAVAVRSSAAAEDGAEASFAGQQETVLGVATESDLVEAVIRCWRSWDSHRSRAYRQRQQVSENGGMAVVVQTLVEAEVSGVLFTRDPRDATGRHMRVEAAWGLGEPIVSGQIQPDSFCLDRDSGELLKIEVHQKSSRLTRAGLVPVPADRQDVACLTPPALCELAALGRRIEALHGGPRDIEWAYTGRFWLLQARPVTAASAYEREAFRQVEMARLKASAHAGGTAWARSNLAEVLPSATPLTWDFVSEFMSTRGGFGLMYADLGFDPAPELAATGFVDLVCARPYVNLSREPALYFRDFPYGYDFAALRADPAKALAPEPSVQGHLATGRTWRRLPSIAWRMWRAHRRVQNALRKQASRLQGEVYPAFLTACAAAEHLDLKRLSPDELLQHLEAWRQRTLCDFARQSLQPSLLAGAALDTLDALLRPALKEHSRIVVRQLLAGVRPPPEADLAGALSRLASGELSRSEFLAEFGHRGPHEMELAQPRWDEQSDDLDALIARAAPTQRPGHIADAADAQPVSHSNADSNDDRWQSVLREKGVPPRVIEAARRPLGWANEYLALRETSKHHFMRGYRVLRRLLVELDRRLELQGGIFYLQRADLPGLVRGQRYAEQIAAARREHRLALSISVPSVLFSDDLEALGRPPKPTGAARWQGTGVSSGVAEGPALVVNDPAAAPADARDFILVCPNTDPAWVPLFLRARALVVETGGVLSHGAIVAREFGLPAVVGIPDLPGQLTSGQRLRVDGDGGTVDLLDV